MVMVFFQVLMHMSATRKWAETSGRTGLEWDALNLVPDLMTHWLTVPHVLASLSSHWSTGRASLLVDGVVNPRQPLFSLIHK